MERGKEGLLTLGKPGHRGDVPSKPPAGSRSRERGEEGAEPNPGTERCGRAGGRGTAPGN